MSLGPAAPQVQALKKELQDWRGRMDGQVKAYRAELGSLQHSLQVDLQVGTPQPQAAWCAGCMPGPVPETMECSGLAVLP
jgi:hypothetical protein